MHITVRNQYNNPNWIFIGGDRVIIKPNDTLPNGTNGTKNPPVTPGKNAMTDHINFGIISTIAVIVAFYWKQLSYERIVKNNSS